MHHYKHVSLSNEAFSLFFPSNSVGKYKITQSEMGHGKFTKFYNQLSTFVWPLDCQVRWYNFFFFFFLLYKEMGLNLLTFNVRKNFRKKLQGGSKRDLLSQQLDYGVQRLLGQTSDWQRHAQCTRVLIEVRSRSYWFDA